MMTLPIGSKEKTHDLLNDCADKNHSGENVATIVAANGNFLPLLKIRDDDKKD